MKLLEISSVIRSKNAGPYELTLDIVFKSPRWFEHAVQTNTLNAELISQLYGVPERDVLHIVAFRIANAIKVTLRRPVASGDIGDTDVYGAQQHAPLLDLELTDLSPEQVLA